MNEDNYRDIFEMGKSYLLTFVSKEDLNAHLELGNQVKRNSINELFRGLLESLSNRQAMPNSIGDIDNLKPFLFSFDPVQIIEEYQDDWRRLFVEIKNNYKPPAKMDITKKKSYWVQFVRGIISASKFLSQFKTVDDFDVFVNQFYLNEYTRAALPMLISKEVDALGFALACDFLKENGYPEFVKPDTHIKDIFNGLDICDSDDDYQVFKKVIRFSNIINEIPYVVDKLFWLIGSGKFYLISEDRLPTNKAKFIKDVLNSF